MSIRFADCRLDRDGRELFRNGESVAIEPRTLDLLLFLVDNRDRAIGKDELQDKVWGTIVSDAALTRAVMKVRKAVGEQSGAPAIVKTVPRFGYRFVAEVMEDVASPAPQATPKRSGRKGIAVLPLANMSGDPENDYFGDGVAEEILNLLAKIPQLRVASRTSSFAFRDSGKTIGEIATAMNVEILLQGSVRRAGNRVRITMQLIDADDDAQLWSEKFDRELDDIFDVQSEIASNVVAALTRGEAGDIPAYRATNDAKAYDLYLRAMELYRIYDRGNMQGARQILRKAVELDPKFARAWAGIANCSSMIYMWWEATEENLQLAVESGKRALDVGPDISESHTAWGFALSLKRRFDEAIIQFEQALQLDPLSFDAWYHYARSRFAEGEIVESGRLFEEAARVRPDDPVSMALASNSYQAAGDLENEMRCCKETARRAERHLLLNPDDTRVLTLTGSCYERMGEFDRGKVLIERALEIGPEDVAILHNAGCFFASSGNIDRALDVFEKRFALSDAYMDWIDNDPDFDPIRDHPRFVAMTARFRE